MKRARGPWNASVILLLASWVAPSVCSAGNEFTPTRLEKAVGALALKLKAKGATGEASYGIVVNALSPFWTATAIGSQVAASELGVAVSFQAPLHFADAEIQKGYIKSMIDNRYKGISISPVNPNLLVDLMKEAREKGVNAIAIDSDMLKDSRLLYVGTDNYRAGVEAGKALIKALGKEGGKVVGTVGNITAPNATERIRGIRDALQGSKVRLDSILVDQNDLEKAAYNARTAVANHPDLKAMVTIYAFDGPAALKALEEAKKLRKIKIVAFDLATEVIQGLKAGTVSAAIGQRPYYWGRLSTYILHAMSVLGVRETLDTLSPYLEGKDRDILDTGIDIVTPSNVGRYLGYLSSLGIKQQ